MRKDVRDQIERLLAIIASWDIQPPPGAADAFERYHDLILEKNEIAGLVSVRDASRIVPRHFLESVALARQIRFHPAMIVMDFGCGAGLPSIPIKLIFPEFPLYLIESKRKKALFLEKAVEELGLENTSVIAERGETLQDRPEYRGIFDIVFARAVGPLIRIVPWCLPFLSDQGRLIIPGSPTKDLVRVEEQYSMWGGIHQIRMFGDGEDAMGSRREMEVLELRKILKGRNLSFGGFQAI